MRKNLAVCSWSLQPSNAGDLCQKVNRTGLDRVQLALDPITGGDWSIDLFAAAFETAQIKLCSGMMTTVDEDYTSLESIKQTGGLRPDKHWEENLERAQSNAKLASALGVDLVTLHAGFIPEPTTSEYHVITDRIKRVNDIFGSHNVELGLETGQERAEDLMVMLDLPNMDAVSVNFDPANMILYGMGDPAQAIEILKDRIAQVHMKDAISTKTPGSWGSEVPAGEGEVDWEHFFRVVDQLPREIDVVIEREAGSNRVQDIKTARSLAIKYQGSA